ncbi:MAG: hypothetical protein WBA87_12600 [Microbacterium sp.]
MLIASDRPSFPRSQGLVKHSGVWNWRPSIHDLRLGSAAGSFPNDLWKSSSLEVAKQADAMCLCRDLKGLAQFAWDMKVVRGASKPVGAEYRDMRFHDDPLSELMQALVHPASHD